MIIGRENSKHYDRIENNIILEFYTRLLIWKLEQIINYPLCREINLMELNHFKFLIYGKAGKNLVNYFSPEMFEVAYD